MARNYPMNYCPVCGTSLKKRLVYGVERAACPACDFIHFCDPKVATVALIEKDGQVLLTRRAMNPAKGQWTFPGGFVDCGEDPRRAAERECREETGLTVQVISLLGLFYGKAHSEGAEILIAYTCRLVDGGTPTPADDVDAVSFFGPDELPELAFQSTRELLQQWKATGKDAG